MHGAKLLPAPPTHVLLLVKVLPVQRHATAIAHQQHLASQRQLGDAAGAPSAAARVGEAGGGDQMPPLGAATGWAAGPHAGRRATAAPAMHAPAALHGAHPHTTHLRSLAARMVSMWPFVKKGVHVYSAASVGQRDSTAALKSVACAPPGGSGSRAIRAPPPPPPGTGQARAASPGHARGIMCLVPVAPGSRDQAWRSCAGHPARPRRPPAPRPRAGTAAQAPPWPAPTLPGAAAGGDAIPCVC